MDIRIDRIAPEGAGIGVSPGSDKIWFVPHSLPGDRLEVVAGTEKPRYGRGRIVRVLEAGAGRVEPACPHHFKPGAELYCGGCDWQHADYTAQLRLKREIVLDSLRRVAKLDCPVAETAASPEVWRYRNKVQVPFQRAPAPGHFAAGFYVPGSHRIVEFEDCLVQPELSVAVARTVKLMARELGWMAYDEGRGGGWLRHLYVRTNVFGEALIAFVTRTRDFPRREEALGALARRHPRVVSVWQNVQGLKTAVILGSVWRRLAGRERMRERLGEMSLELSPGAFLQVNTPAAELLYAWVERLLYADALQPRLVLDLYSGAGAIALWLARSAGEGAFNVLGVEESAQAVRDARANARRLGFGRVRFAQGRAEFELPRLRGLDEPRPWAAVLDPPRAGCEPGVLRWLCARQVERLIYVSCNPATFARDARRLAASYVLREVRPVDLFPQTSHVELAALFDLGRRSADPKTAPGPR